MPSESGTSLPNAILAIVEERRIRTYLLEPMHPVGGAKARFFLAYGFTPDAWRQLQAALLHHGRVNAVTRRIETPWGNRYTVACNCPTPDGRNPCIRTVWQMESGVPRLLTAIPI